MAYINFNGSTITGIFSVSKRKTRIGRSSDADIVINDVRKLVSRKQMDIYEDDEGKIFLQDLDSKNGTYVNKKLVGKRDMINEPYELKNGDVVTFGSFYHPESFEVNILENFALIKNENTKQNKLQKVKMSKPVDYYLNANLSEEKQIGEGHYAKVFLVKDENGNQFVKKVPKSKSVGIQAKFRRECSNLLQMHHPNIIQAYVYRHKDVNDLNSEMCLIMEYAEEGNLEEYVDSKGGKLDIFESIEITIQLLEALTYMDTVSFVAEIINDGILYTCGITHRDICPRNILSFNNHSLFKIGDFGLSKARAAKEDIEDEDVRTQSTDEKPGHVRFASKLQATKYIDALAYFDLFACVAVLFYMLTGRYIREKAEEINESINVSRMKAAETDIYDRYENMVNIEALDRLVKFINDILLEEDKKTIDEKDEVQYTTAAEAKDILTSIYYDLREDDERS